MSQDDLQDYDPSAYPPVAVTVDLVLMSVVEGQLTVLLQRRDQTPFAGVLALPGGFVGPKEALDEAAARVLSGKAGFGGKQAWLEQLYTFGSPARDPRMRIVSVAYFALLPASELAEAVAAGQGLVQMPLAAMEEALAFDHADIVALAHERLKGKLDYAPLAFALLPARFTLRDLQAVHEAILGTSLNKPAFRRRMLDSGWIAPTGEREVVSTFRPAELYRCVVRD